MIGEWEFDYAILPHSGDWQTALQPARAFNVPLRALTTEQHNGQLPSTLSFLQIEPKTFAISAVKACEDGAGWLVRAVNLEGQARKVRLQLWRPATSIARANLLEQPIAPMASENGLGLTFSVDAHQITTIRFD